MKQLLFFTFSLFVFTQCGRPVALFELDDLEYDAPVLINIINHSKNAESYQWLIDGYQISESMHLRHIILESGNYNLELKASKGKRSSSIVQKIYVRAPKHCSVYMNTSKGEMTFVLNENTPVHLQNFIDLVEQGYYNGIMFHRVIDGFVIQAGDDTARRDNEKNFKSNTEIPNEINTRDIHVRGALAAARMPDNLNPERASSGTQFYVVDGRELELDDLKRFEASKLVNYSREQIEAYLENGGAPQLDEQYTVFGYLIHGKEVLEEISRVKTDERDKPIDPVEIIEMKIIN